MQPKDCIEMGNCGKDARTAALQDLLLRATIEMSTYAHRARQLGKVDPELDRAMLQALFSTVTNVNFDPARLEVLVRDMAGQQERARLLCEAAGEPAPAAADRAWRPAADIDDLVSQGIRWGSGFACSSSAPTSRAFTARSQRPSGEKVRAPCEPSPAPVPVPPVEKAPAGVRVPSGARENASTSFPAGSFESV